MQTPVPAVLKVALFLFLATFLGSSVASSENSVFKNSSASVLSAFSSFFQSAEPSCYVQGDIDTLNSKKVELESSLTGFNGELGDINEKISSYASEINTIQSKVDELQTTRVTESELQAQQQKVVPIQAKIDELKNIESIEERINSLNAVASEQNKELKQIMLDMSSLSKSLIKVKALASSGQTGSFSRYLAAQSAVESTQKAVDDAKKALVIAQDIEDKRKQLQSLTLQYNSLNRKIASVSRSAQSAYIPTLKKLAENIKSITADIQTLTNKIVTEYKVSSSSTSVYYWNGAISRANQAYAVAQRNLATYARSVPEEYRGMTATEINAQYTDLQDKYNALIKQKTEIQNKIRQERGDLVSFKNEYTTKSRGFLRTYFYQKLPTSNSLSGELDAVQAGYQALLDKNSSIESQINSLNSDKDSLSNTINELNNQYNEVQQKITDTNNEIQNILTDVTNMSGNMCPVIESVCDDGKDNDRNGQTDCQDTACSSAPVCNANNNTNQTNNTIIDTTVSIPEICDNGVDDDSNGVIDCGDSSCSGDPSCTVGGGDIGTGIVSTTEICDNRTDDDQNGETDCSDSACSSDPSCACQITDDFGNVIGLCDSMDSNGQTTVNGGAGGGAAGSKSSSGEQLVTNPNDCPSGTKAVKFGTGGGKTFYKCEAETNTASMECPEVCVSVENSVLLYHNGPQCPNGYSNDNSYNPPVGEQKIKCGDCVCRVPDAPPEGSTNKKEWFIPFYSKIFTW